MISLSVPKYQEISVEKLWSMVKEWPDLLDYFPDYEANQLPERDFIIGVLSTQRISEMKELIKDARSHRSLANRKEEDEMIEMTYAAKNEIFDILPQKSK